MTTTDQSALVRYPGRLVMNPVSVGAGSVWPYGGTPFGLVRDIALVVRKFLYRATEEALGVEVSLDKLVTGESWGIAAVLEASDQGFLDQFFMSSQVGVSTGETGVIYPGNSNGPPTLPGTWLGARAIRLLFAPHDTMQRFLYFKKAGPSLEEQARMLLSGMKRFGAPVAFDALPPDDGSETAQWRPREDLVL